MLFISGIHIALLKRGNIAVTFSTGLDVRQRAFPLLFLPCYSNLCPLCVCQEVMYFPEVFFFFFLWINFKSNFKRRVRLLSLKGLCCRLFPKHTCNHVEKRNVVTCWLTETPLTRQLHALLFFHSNRYFTFPWTSTFSQTPPPKQSESTLG